MKPLTPHGPRDFSVMTVNVRFGLADAGQFSWENRKPAFRELFSAWRPDFIAMQEVNDFQRTFFRTVLNEYRCLGGRRPAPPFWQDVLIFYKQKWECRADIHFFLSDTPTIPSRMPDSQWPRQAVMGRFARDNIQLVCLNTHFDFSEAVQTKSVDIMIDQLTAFSEKDMPEIITGDFNATPADSCHQSLTDNRRITPPFCDAFEKDAPGTFHNFTGRPVGGRIDWILCRNKVELKAKKIITDRFAGTYPSDHFPVYAVFECLL